MTRYVFLLLIFLARLNSGASQVNYVYPLSQGRIFWNPTIDLEVQPLHFYSTNSVKSIKIQTVEQNDTLDFGFVHFTDFGQIDSVAQIQRYAYLESKRQKKTEDVFYQTMGYDSLHILNSVTHYSDYGENIWDFWKSTRYKHTYYWEKDSIGEVVECNSLSTALYTKKLKKRFGYILSESYNYVSLKDSNGICGKTITTEILWSNGEKEINSSKPLITYRPYFPNDYTSSFLAFDTLLYLNDRLVYWRPMCDNGYFMPTDNIYYRYTYTANGKIKSISRFMDSREGAVWKKTYNYAENTITEKEYELGRPLIKKKEVYSKKEKRQLEAKETREPDCLNKTT